MIEKEVGDSELEKGEKNQISYRAVDRSTIQF